jgi:glycosidase
MLTFYRSLIDFRLEEPTLRRGVCEFHEQKNPNLMVFSRTLGKNRMLVVLNFSSQRLSVALGEFGLRSSDSEEMFSTSPVPLQPRFSYDSVLLDRYEGVVFRLPDLPQPKVYEK